MPNIVNCHLKKGYPILEIFSKFILGTTGHQIDRSIFHLTQCLLLHYLRKTEPMNMSWNEQKYVKKLPTHYQLLLKENWQILIIFGAIFDTTCHQMSVLVPTLPNVCLCTISENPNRRNRIKMQYFIGFVSPGSAKADNGCGGKFDSHLTAGCVKNVGVKNY